MKNIQTVPFSRAVITLVCVSLLLALRAIILLNGEMEVSGDATNYLRGLQHIISTGELPPLSAQPVGYSVFLSVFHFHSMGPEILYIELAQKMMDIVVVGVLIFISLEATKNSNHMLRAAMLALIILQPFTSTMMKSIYTEQSAMFFTFLGLFFSCYLFPRTRKVLFLISGGVFLGIAGIMRIDVLALNTVVGLGAIFILLPRFSKIKNTQKVLALISLLAIPIIVLAWQYKSTQEVGYVVKKFHYPGYMSWLRTWPADRAEYQGLAFFSEKKDRSKAHSIEQYPSKSFVDDQQKTKISALINSWNINGYTQEVDQQWGQLASENIQASTLQYYVLNPLYRMTHFWVNTDGAQFYLSTIDIKPPTSSAIVGLTLAMRLLLLILFAMGVRRLFVESCKTSPLRIFMVISSVYVISRTVELGVLGLIAWGGLMEVRYVIVAFPFLIVVSLNGALYLQNKNP